jgi:hypothetical protein
VERLPLGDEPGATWSAASHRGFGDEIIIDPATVDVEGDTLNPYDWSASIGGFKVGIVRTVSGLFRHLTRGTFVRLLVGFEGMRLAEFETVAIGVVQNVRGTGPWTLECGDLFSGLSHRLTRTDTELLLFEACDDATILTADYTAGDSTITVNSVSNFTGESGGSGAVLITPSSGDPFYRLWSSTTGSTVFNVTSPGTVSVMGTTDADASSGDTVTEVAYLQGHPMDIARKVLASNGVSGNGEYDLYTDATWGFGIPDSLIDHGDIELWKALVVAVGSGSYLWEYPKTGREEDAIGWLRSFLASAGVFLTTRQGQITCRAAQASVTHTGYLSHVHITDADIAEVEEYEAFASDHETEWSQIRVITATGNDESDPENLQTFPASRRRPFDVSDRVFSNEGAVREEMLGRLYESSQRVPERVVLRCVGLRLAILTNGDIVKLTTRRVCSRIEGDAGYDARSVLVSNVSPAWGDGTVRIALHVYPTSTEDFAP